MFLKFRGQCRELTSAIISYFDLTKKHEILQHKLTVRPSSDVQMYTSGGLTNNELNI